MTELPTNEILQNNSSIQSTNDSPKSEHKKQKEKQLAKCQIWLDKLKIKLACLNQEVESQKEENQTLNQQFLKNQQENKELKEQFKQSRQLNNENEELNIKNSLLAAEILYNSQMKYQKPLEKFPKIIKKLKGLKNFPNNLRIQNLTLSEGSMFNGDEVEKIISAETYNIITELPWNCKKFNVSWRQRPNSQKPTNSWVYGKQLDQYYPKKLFAYYQKNSNYFG